MKHIHLILLAILSVLLAFSASAAEETLSVQIHHYDSEPFSDQVAKRVDVYLNVMDQDGNPVTGLDNNSLQGDRICTEYYAALDDGCPVLDLSDCPDLGPVLFAYAAMHSGGRFTGTDRLRLKESDRCESMKAELEKFEQLLLSDK